MVVSREEILQWMREHDATIKEYADAHSMTPQEVIDMLNGKVK